MLLPLLLVLGIPPLTADDRGVLETARDGAYDHQEPAFAALAAHVAAWTSDDPGDAPIRLAPDLTDMREHPQNYRGDLCRIEGRIEMIERLYDPWSMFEAWFVRSASGEPALIYVHRPAGADTASFRPGQHVRLVARFLKRFEAVPRGSQQTGQTRGYPAFVGAHPRHVASEPAGAWVLPVMAGAVGLAGLVVVMLIVIARRAAARDRQRLSRALDEPEEPDEPLNLPADPAEALAVLRRHSGADVVGAGVPPADRERLA